LNDFGEEIRVQREMINEREGGSLVEEWFELANGCVCCTVKHSLVQALEQLVQMKGRFCYLLNSLINAFDLPSPVSIV
jgi:G3E family GTPase